MIILFTGGGTLGPVTPLLATIEALKKINPIVQPVWVGTRRGVERAVVTSAGIPYRAIAAGKLRRYFDVRNVLDIFWIGVGFVQSLWIIARVSPAAVVVSGAYVQVPLVFAAWMARVPVVLHQQDVEMGLANRISRVVSSVNTAAFTSAIPQFGKQKVTVIGNPVRAFIGELADPSIKNRLRIAGRKRWNFADDKPTLLVLGGGTGAQGINERITRTIDELIAFANVIHVTGKGKMVEVKPRQGYIPVEFLNDELNEAYAVADLAVTRAGLGTLTELCTAGVSSVLLPLPGHQEKNAAFVAGSGAGVVVANDIPDRRFVDTVRILMLDADRLRTMTSACSTLFPLGAAEKLAKIILEVTKD